MPLSPPVARQQIHNRDIIMNGYRRDDGLWDIEAHLTDVKSYSFHTSGRGDVPAGEPIHGLWLRLTVDDDLTVRGVEIATDYTPFATCSWIARNFQQLVGLSIAAGWNKAVREKLGGVQGCTHLVELLGPLGTVAFQTIISLVAREPAEKADAAGVERPKERPGLLNTCHIFASDGPVVKEHWPDFYTGPEEAAAAE